MCIKNFKKGILFLNNQIFSSNWRVILRIWLAPLNIISSHWFVNVFSHGRFLMWCCCTVGVFLSQAPQGYLLPVDVEVDLSSCYSIFASTVVPVDATRTEKWREIDTASRSAEFWQSFGIHIPRFSHLWRSKMTRRGDLVVVLSSSEGLSLLLVGIVNVFELALPLNCVLAVMIQQLCRGGSCNPALNSILLV